MPEQYDLMHYPNLAPQGLMTKEEAKEYAKTIPAGHYVIGWVHGTCQSVFQFWSPSRGHAMEIPHNEKPPEGRAAAIAWTRIKENLECTKI